MPGTARRRFQIDSFLAWIIHLPLGVSQLALTVRFREPVGASPGPEFASEIA